jgi:hypothetical protein
MAGFDRRFAFDEPCVTFVPGRSIVVQGQKLLAQESLAVLQVLLAILELRLVLRQGLFARLGQLDCFGFGCPLAVTQERFLMSERFGPRVEFLLTFVPPGSRAAELALQFGLLGSDLAGAAVQLFSLALQMIGQLGRVLAKLIKRVFDRRVLRSPCCGSRFSDQLQFATLLCSMWLPTA